MLSFYKDITFTLRFLHGQLILKGTTASLGNCGHIIRTKYQSSFKNSLLRIEHLTMLFAAQKVLYILILTNSLNYITI